MAERRSARTKRKPDDDELARLADDVFSEEPQDEEPEEPEDEAAEEPEEPEDEAAEEPEEPEDEAAEEPEEPEDELEDEEPEEPEDEAAEEPEDEELEEPEDEAAEEDPVQDERPRRSRTGGLTAAKAGQAALRQITELTGKGAEGVTGVERADDGSWLVGIEVVEDRRIPSSTDILATYETEIDEDGELVSYRRVRRYSRGRGDDGDA